MKQQLHVTEVKIKKPIYKKWWFWVIALIVIGIIGSGSNGSKPNTAPTTITSKDSTEATATSTPAPTESKQDVNTENTEPETFVNTAEATELFTGEFTVGTDIKPGRYVITCDSGSGNLFVYNGQMPYINEILSNSLEDSMGLGVTKIEVDLSEGQTIQISGLNNVIFSPATIEQKTSLSSGYHIVGRDVPAGDYIATAPNGSGNFFVYSKNGMPKVNEILGKDDFGLAVEKVKFSVQEGDLIQISSLENVELN